MLDADWQDVQDRLGIPIQSVIAKELREDPEWLLDAFATTFGGVVGTGNPRVDRALARFRSLRDGIGGTPEDVAASGLLYQQDLTLCLLMIVLETERELRKEQTP